MKRDPYRGSKRNTDLRLPAVVMAVAALLVTGILVLAGGKDDPVSEQLVPPVASEPTSTADQKQAAIQAANQSAAIDGAPMTKAPSTAPPDHIDHDTTEPPADQATNAGGMQVTAKRFAELMINRPTDQIESAELNKQLITLANGNLAADLNQGTGSIATAQAPSSGEILDTIQLSKEGNYGEVLIIAKESLIDPTTKQPLDPSYINYVVRLDHLPGKGWAVTSWEPQL